MFKNIHHKWGLFGLMESSTSMTDSLEGLERTLDSVRIAQALSEARSPEEFEQAKAEVRKFESRWKVTFCAWDYRGLEWQCAH